VIGEKADQKSGSGGKKYLPLNSFDVLFKETRDVNFRVLGPVLHKKAESVSSTYDERHKVTGSVSEMHAFMQKFKTAHADHNYLQTHINLAERISQVRLVGFHARLIVLAW
jgi:hypothetical protein